MKKLDFRIGLKTITSLTCLLILFLFTSCDKTDTATSSVPASTESDTAVSSDNNFPVTIKDNCGVTVTFDKAPTRVVIGGNGVAEIVQELGALDKIAGTAGLKGRESKLLGDQVKNIPSVYDATTMADQEAMLAAKPDAIIFTYNTRFTAESLGTREEWAARGVPTLILAGGCDDASTATYDQFYQSIRDIGLILGKHDQGVELAEKIKARLSAITTNVGDPVDVFTFDRGKDTPVYYGEGIYATLIDSVGTKDIFKDLRPWGDTSWEVIALRDPEAIIVNDYSSGTTDSRDINANIIRNNPALSQTRAVKNDNIYIMDYTAVGPSITFVNEAEKIHKFLQTVRNKR